MSWRVVVVSSNAKLDYKSDYLVVRTTDNTKRIHLSEIAVLMLESTAISLTAYLLCELAKRKIDVVFCDEKRLPLATCLPLYGSYDTSLKFRKQVQWNQEMKDLIWAEIVRAKVGGQIAVLEEYKKEEANLLSSYLPQIQPADETNREGHAAKVYFNALFGMDFSRTQDNNINVALNYGYSIILSVFAREVVANGYSTQLGIFHSNMFNEFNLACDLMEPFRPFIDYTVSRMLLLKFEHDEKMHIVKTLNKKVIIDGQEQFMLNAVKIYAKSVFEALNENDVAKIRFPNYELQIYENDRLF